LNQSAKFRSGSRNFERGGMLEKRGVPKKPKTSIHFLVSNLEFYQHYFIKFWESASISEIGGAEGISKWYVVYTHHDNAFDVKNKKIKKSRECIFNIDNL
jgi:hypothetical protein